MSQLEVLRKMLADGKTHGVDAIEKRIARLNGRMPSRNALHVYLNTLKKEGFKFDVADRGAGKVTKYTAIKVPRSARA